MRVWCYCDIFFEIVGFIKEDVDSYIMKYFSNYEDLSFVVKLIKKLDCEKELRELSLNLLNIVLLCLFCEDIKGLFFLN